MVDGLEETLEDRVLIFSLKSVVEQTLKKRLKISVLESRQTLV